MISSARFPASGGTVIRILTVAGALDTAGDTCRLSVGFAPSDDPPTIDIAITRAPSLIDLLLTDRQCKL